MPDALHEILFPNDGQHTYAVIDGASCEDLLDRLDEFSPRHYCLYAGEIEPDVEEVAPHLVELLPEHPFTAWLLAEGFGKHWGIFARSPVGLRAMRKHLRTFLLVQSPEGKPLYFRYYDPRVLGNFLRTCNLQQIRSIFGPVTIYFCEDVQRGLVAYRQTEGQMEEQVLFEGKANALLQ